MKRRRLGECWDNLDFRHPERLNFRVRFRFKKAPFSPPFVYKPFSKSQKNEKTPAICPYIGNPLLATSFTLSKHRLPALTGRNATPATHFPVQTPMKSVPISLAPRIIHPPPMYENALKDVYFSSPETQKESPDDAGDPLFSCRKLGYYLVASAIEPR